MCGNPLCGYPRPAKLKLLVNLRAHNSPCAHNVAEADLGGVVHDELVVVECVPARVAHTRVHKLSQGHLRLSVELCHTHLHAVEGHGLRGIRGELPEPLGAVEALMSIAITSSRHFKMGK